MMIPQQEASPVLTALKDGQDTLVKFHQLITVSVLRINVDDSENVSHQLPDQIMFNASACLVTLELFVKLLLLLALTIVKMKELVLELMTQPLKEKSLVSVLSLGLDKNVNGTPPSLLVLLQLLPVSLELSSLLSWPLF